MFSVTPPPAFGSMSLSKPPSPLSEARMDEGTHGKTIPNTQLPPKSSMSLSSLGSIFHPRTLEDKLYFT